ncbi:BQ2448_2208 [Microbotryum intermedium]|uniref:BQ2448_2208 protein n=1 Tax=Microbotryum intermedium TaxID=269621 RepID=A0A238FDG7_9BASI|nr:BQ2448_2208 [Microbotryum intermedium]
MQPTTRRLISSTSTCLARAPRGRSGPTTDGFDMATMIPGTGSGAGGFDFPLTRPTILKMQEKRLFLHYLRLEHLQFPDLVALRREYKKPSSKQIVRVRHQHYQGEPHPAARKVTISVNCDDLASTLGSEQAQHKFKLLAGPRWDATNDEVKLSCELFPTPEMNERWCSETLDKMIAEAKDLSDPMSDIPLDPRPTLSRLAKSGKHKIVTLSDFPKEWLPSSNKRSTTRKVPATKESESTGTTTSSAGEGTPATEAHAVVDVQDLPSAGVGKQGGAEISAREA